jgi:hypothetical protein
MRYRETYRIEPERVFDSDVKVTDVVVLVLGIIGLIVVGAFA